VKLWIFDEYDIQQSFIVIIISSCRITLLPLGLSRVGEVEFEKFSSVEDTIAPLSTSADVRNSLFQPRGPHHYAIGGAATPEENRH